MKELLPVVFTSAVVATIVGTAINAWLESRKSKWVARFNALKASVTLEGYALECDSGGAAGKYLADVPELPKLTITAGFLRPAKAKLANRLMVFPQDVIQAEQAVAFYWDVLGGVEDTSSEAANQSARVGLNSLNLARDIRAEFKLPPRKMIIGKFEIREVLSKSVEENT